MISQDCWVELIDRYDNVKAFKTVLISKVKTGKSPTGDLVLVINLKDGKKSTLFYESEERLNQDYDVVRGLLSDI